MDLVPHMYWERQEPGSQLCAQHCLNNLLQQNTYTEFDLAELAQQLDQAENATLGATHQNKKSYNYDDSGFFSISVLERALEVWDLSLVRWRGEAMKPYQEHPEDQAAFILNLSQHWLPLRRFSPHPPTSSAHKRWYNLNSFLPGGPEWISPTYLRMVLVQAEQEGYSVFVVRKASKRIDKEGKGWSDGGIGVLPECVADRMAVELGEPAGRGGAGNHPLGQAGSSREAAYFDQPTVDPSSLPSSAGPSSPPARRRKRQEDLIPTSPEASGSLPPRPPRRNYPSNPGPEQGMEFDMDPTGEISEHHLAGPDAIGSIDPFGNEDAEDGHGHRNYGGPTDFSFQSRSYDDEDAALQAALKASMADLPPGWVAPELKPKEQPIRRESHRASEREAALRAADEERENQRKRDEEERKRLEKQKKAEEDDGDDEPKESLTADEIRRRRLAKFGQ